MGKAMNRLVFTKTAVGQISANGRRARYYDTQTPHMTLMVTPKGVKSFYLYRKVNGRPEEVFLGHFPAMTVEQARRRVDELNGAVARGENPADRKRAERAEMTLGGLYQRYLEDHIRARGKRAKNPQSYWKLYLSPWASRKLSVITRADVRVLHARIGRTAGKVTANKTLTMLRAMLNRALKWDLYEGENPAAGIERFRETARDRFLQADELPRFFAALAEEPNDTIRDYLLLSLLTGARRANVQAMRWEDVSLERGTWRIPQPKNGEPHTVPLVPEALDVLAQRQRTAAGPWVFPGHGHSGHLEEPKRAWARILERAGIEDLHIHDLRRTLGSWQAATGSSLITIGKTLAHKNVSTTAIYARLNLDPIRESMNTATRAMLEAGGLVPKAEVVDLRKAQGEA
jgi:integrase